MRNASPFPPHSPGQIDVIEVRHAGCAVAPGGIVAVVRGNPNDRQRVWVYEYEVENRDEDKAKRSVVGEGSGVDATELDGPRTMTCPSCEQPIAVPPMGKDLSRGWDKKRVVAIQG